MKKFKQDNKGSVLVTVAVVLPVLILAVLGSIDFMKVSKTQSKFETAVDNALLSAVAKSVSTVPTETAQNYFNYNFSGEDGFQLNSLQVTFDEANFQWTVEASGNTTTFLDLIGSEEEGFNLYHKATVEWDTESLVELVFTIDTSASMCMETVRSEREDNSLLVEFRPDNSCTKLNAMKTALSNIIDNGITPLEGIGGPTYKVGIVPFNHKVKMPDLADLPMPLTMVESTHSKGSANYFTNFDDAEPLAEVYPLTAVGNAIDLANLKNHINNIEQQPEGLGWTRSNIAALSSAMMLDPEYHRHFDGARPTELLTGSEKIVVLMTDGANMGCCYAAHPEGNFENQYLYLYQVDNAHLVGLEKANEILGDSFLNNWTEEYAIPEEGVCQQMKENNITVFSVVFDVDDRDTGGRQIKDAFKDCASNHQFYFDVSTPEELQLAYETIAQSLIKIRIVK